MGQKIHYPAFNGPDGSATAEFLTLGEAIQEAPGLVGVIAESYTVQFETGARPMLAPGTVRGRYDPENPDHLERYRNATRDHYADGGQIVVVRDPATLAIEAFAKAKPAPNATEEKLPGCYVNDIIARPPHLRGLGSLVLHAQLKFGEHDQGQPVMWDAFVGSRINRWYRRLGLVPRQDIATEDFTLDEQNVLRAVTYHTRKREGLVLRDVVNTLEDTRPHLAFAYPLAA